MVRKLGVEGFSGPVDRRYGQRLSYFLKMRLLVEQDRIAIDLLPQFRQWQEFRPTAMMALDEVRSLEGCEIGAHAYGHSSMEFESDEYS
jgi:hypothetical protein